MVETANEIDAVLQMALRGRVLEIIAKTVFSSRLKVRSLYATAGVSFLVDEDTVLTLKYTLKSLQTLWIRVNLEDTAKSWIQNNTLQQPIYTVDEVHSKGLFGQIFEEAQKLETLCVDFDHPPYQRWQHSSLPIYLGRKAWPHLHTLQLKDITVDVHSILGIIKRNGSSLKVVSMVNINFLGPQWPRFFDALRNLIEDGQLKLQSIVAQNLLLWTKTANIGDDEQHPFFWKCDTQLPRDYDEELDGKYIEELHEIVHVESRWLLSTTPLVLETRWRDMC